MEASDHMSVSSSTSKKPSSTPKSMSAAFSTDENDQSVSLQNSNKSTTTKKNFMSPTISTASKAIAPRKKILAERNEISDTHVQISTSLNLSDDSLSLNDDSSLKPDDPLTNYPSPRPKFLRYKPNRRREMVLSHENKDKEEADLVSASDEGKEADERAGEMEEGEEEEVEEEREGFWRRVWRCVLVLLVLVFSTIYISSMNSPKTSPTLQAIQGLKDEWYLKIHDGVYETTRSLRNEHYFLKGIAFKEIVKIVGGDGTLIDGNLGLVKVNQTLMDDGYEEEEMVGDVHLGKVEEMLDNLREVVELQGGDCEEFGEMVELQVGENENAEGFDQMLEHFELKGTDFDVQQESEVEPVHEVGNLVAGGLETVESQMEKGELIARTETTDFDVLNSEGESNFDILNSEGKSNLQFRGGLLGHIETDAIFKAAVTGVTLLVAVIASLALASNLKKNRKVREDSFPIVIPCSNESVMEKCSLLVPTTIEEDVKCIDSLSSSMSLINSTVKDSKDMLQRREPYIELLGEFEVRQMSSSLRSCGMKSRMEESEVSSHSVSSQKEFQNWSKALSVSAHAPSDFSEFSAKNSLSNECFTPEKKIPKKQFNNDGEEAKKAVTTPVRRSSRIRNRAITSP